MIHMIDVNLGSVLKKWVSFLTNLVTQNIEGVRGLQISPASKSSEKSSGKIQISFKKPFKQIKVLQILQFQLLNYADPLIGDKGGRKPGDLC